MIDRGARLAGPSRPRFRCLACARFVHGTELGHCPRCGWQPPSMIAIGAARPRRAWWLAALAVAITAIAILAR